MRGLPKIRFDAFAPRIKLRNADDGGPILLLCRLPKQGLSLVNIQGQALATQVHECGVVQATHFTLLGRLDK